MLGETRTAREWVEDSARRFREALHSGYDNLAMEVIEELFLLYNSPLPEVRPFTFDNAYLSVPAFVLRAEHPQVRSACGLLSCSEGDAVGTLQFTDLDSLRPALRWERFPRAGEVPWGGEIPRIENVRYHLKLFRARREPVTNRLLPGDLVIDRRDLAETAFTPPAPLYACTRYFWTVRARLRLHGEARVLEWAGGRYIVRSEGSGFASRTVIYGPPRLRRLARPAKSGSELQKLEVESSNYYCRFATPCDS